jgi:hypothetical protein
MKGESKREENGTESIAAFHGKTELLLATQASTLSKTPLPHVKYT